MSRERDDRIASSWSLSWKRLLLLSAACVGCAHAAAAQLSAPTPPSPSPLDSRGPIASDRVPPTAEGRNPSAADIVQILSQSGLRFATVDPGHRWQVSFAGHDRGEVLIDIIYTDSFTIVLGKLFTLPAQADTEIYKAIAERNFELEQMKLSVDRTGSVFASFEVPTRIIDRRELLENIASLAAALDSLHLDDVPNGPPHGPARHPHLTPEGPRATPPPVETIGAPARRTGSADTIL